MLKTIHLHNNYYYTAPEVLKEIHSLLKVLVSESDRHRKNLDAVRHELDSLKSGFTLLQNAQSELTADTERQSSEMKDLEKVLTSQGKDIDKLGTCVSVDDETDTCETELESLYTDNRNTLDSQSNEAEELGMCEDTQETAAKP